MEQKLILATIVVSVIGFLLLIRYFVIRRRMKQFTPQYHSREQVEKFNDLLRTVGLAFDPRLDIFYSLQDCWQREFGYHKVYDEMAATFNWVLDCEPIVFDYDNKRWMIELWKGQYGITIGAEVGIYIEDGEYTYRSATSSEELFVRYHLWKGKKLVASREQRGWWITSFSVGGYAKPKYLSMAIDISFHDSEMSEIFYEAMIKKGYSLGSLGLWGNTVRIRYEHPYSPQPASNTSVWARAVMVINRINCRIFCSLTRKQTCTLDKLEYIKLRLPILYHFITKILFIREKKNGRM
ncbi:MAG: DUF4474 domain-containing protein [Velocimicrobium sp.]